MIKHIQTKLPLLLLSFTLISPIAAFEDSDNSTERQAARKEMRELKAQEQQLKAKQRLLRLKEALKLKENQLAAWEDYKKVLLLKSQEKRNLVAELRSKHKEKQQKPNALELASLNITRQEHKLEAAKSQLKALEVFYTQLDAEQKLVVDKVVMRRIKHKAKQLREQLREQRREGKTEKRKQKN